MQKFNFNKLWISTKELLKITSIAESTLYRFIAEWTKAGNDPKDMGRIRLSGMKSDRWDPRVFVGWLIKHKLEQPIQFNYEFKEKETLKQMRELKRHNDDLSSYLSYLYSVSEAEEGYMIKSLAESFAKREKIKIVCVKWRH